MAMPTPQRPSPASLASRALWFSSERLQGVVLAVALFALELLPLYTWLLIAGGIGANTIDAVPLPFTYLVVTWAIFALLALALRQRPITVTVLLEIPVGVVALVVAARISPGAYGAVPGGPLDLTWLQAFLTDVTNISSASSRLEALVLLAMVLVFLGWRGLIMGCRTPDFDDVLDRFKVSGAAMVLAAVVATVLPDPARTQLVGTLTLFLPLTFFVGLLAAAISRAALHREELAGSEQKAAGGNRWLAMAVVLAGLVMLMTLVVGAIASFGSVTGALGAAGPAGQILNTLLNWLADGVVTVFAVIFAVIYTLLSPIFALAAKGATPPPAQTATSSLPPGSAQTSHLEITIISLVLLVGLLLLGVYWIRRLFVLRRDPLSDAIVEERESLGGGGLLLAQLRDLFGRHARQPQLAEEALPAGSARALFRDVLRAAARRQVGRAPAETADEFSARLARTFPGAVQPDDVAQLGAAYDAARYGEREEPAGRRRELRERAQRVLAALRQERTG